MAKQFDGDWLIDFKSMSACQGLFYAQKLEKFVHWYLHFYLLHTIIWYQIFLSNINDFQTDLFDL